MIAKKLQNRHILQISGLSPKNELLEYRSRFSMSNESREFIQSTSVLQNFYTLLSAAFVKSSFSIHSFSASEFVLISN
jgi:hypothetical protein